MCGTVSSMAQASLYSCGIAPENDWIGGRAGATRDRNDEFDGPPGEGITPRAASAFQYVVGANGRAVRPTATGHRQLYCEADDRRHLRVLDAEAGSLYLHDIHPWF